MNNINMDKEATGHILRAIIEKSKQDTVDGVPLLSVAQSFIPQELYDVLEHGVRPWPEMSDASMGYYKVLTGINDFKDMSPDIYWYIWKLLLYLEHHQCIWEMKQYQLYNQRIVRSKNRAGEFNIRVPGLSEDRPSVRARDFVDITQVNGENHCKSEVMYVGSDYVSVSVSTSFSSNFKDGQTYSVEFRYCEWQMNCLNYILNSIHKYKLSPMLFPENNNQSHPTTDISFDWINSNVESNHEQQQAVKNIFSKTARPAPYILFGPPGTGKTSTLVEAICQIMKYNSSTRILICTPSNAAADEIALRLLSSSIDENSLYRMYSASRNINDINENIKPFSNFVDTQSVFISHDVFLMKKIVITTLATSIRLYNYNLRENHFSYLFVDEAGQATELETLIPFVLLSGEDSHDISKFYAQIVIAGDPKQLGPVIQSKIAEPLLGRSMLERLMEWGPYRKNEMNKYNPIFVTKLVQNYRCHNAILHIPNKLFYDGELVTCGGYDTTKALNWSGLPKKNFPVIFHAVKGDERRESYSPSVYNNEEVGAVMNYVRKLLKTQQHGCYFRQEDIGIITPYKLQRAKIHDALQCENFNNISVGTVEIFQGQERNVIIISTVRTVIYRLGERIHVGFLSNPKRFNVALTRAKGLLIVIGNPEILQHDVHWREFIEYCVTNESCSGEKFQLTTHAQMNSSQIRRLLGKKHIVQQNGNTETDESIVEDPNEDVEEAIVPRRRRLPIGPLPTLATDSGNTSDSSLSEPDIDYNKQYLAMEMDFSDEENYDFCDDYVDDDYNTDDNSCIDESTYEKSDHSDISDCDVEDGEDAVEAQLRERMRNLKINKSS